MVVADPIPRHPRNRIATICHQSLHRCMSRTPSWRAESVRRSRPRYASRICPTLVRSQ